MISSIRDFKFQNISLISVFHQGTAWRRHLSTYHPIHHPPSNIPHDHHVPHYDLAVRHLMIHHHCDPTTPPQTSEESCISFQCLLYLFKIHFPIWPPMSKSKLHAIWTLNHGDPSNKPTVLKWPHFGGEPAVQRVEMAVRRPTIWWTGLCLRNHKVSRWQNQSDHSITDRLAILPTLSGQISSVFSEVTSQCTMRCR